MALGNEQRNHNDKQSFIKSAFMQKFKLYETRSNFYMIGSDKTRSFWKVLKIDRVESAELNICEDSISYSELECYDLLRRIHEGNKPTGGLNFVTICYGIVGFIKFLGPYYMMLITKRKKIGAICGHTVYSIAKTEIIPIPNSEELSKIAYSKNENKYKKLLCTVDLTKDFFFSYSYHIMCSLQKNICGIEKGQKMYETMFVWNEFLTRGIRNLLKNTAWTVALVYGFFKQMKLSVSGKDFMLSLIARRSRHFAGTRYLKRGVNDKGRVANDVETEQIVFEDVPQGEPLRVTSVLQNRGSIPLFWSQETSRLNIKPDIILSKKDQNFEATRRHFENLANRYGHPIIVLNLIKSCEKKPRESILRAEFANAIDVINKDLYEENRLKFLHWDLHKQSRSKAINVLSLLGKVSSYALNLTGIFHCQVTPILRSDEGILNEFSIMEDNDLEFDFKLDVRMEKDDGDLSFKNPSLQKGILRTNCIDCLDRTNVAQYAFGFVALGHQLHDLGLIDCSVVDIDDPLASDLMEIYEKMGDTLALQYGGSAAHNKIFSERRGQWKATAQSQEFFRTIQRYYSNVYMDAEKQDAINVFLGHFQPHEDRPALWELDSDQHYNIGRHVPSLSDDRCLFKRSLSDGNIICKSSPNDGNQLDGDKHVLEKCKGINKGLYESTPEISAYGSDISLSRYVRSIPRKTFLTDMHRDQCFASACSQICFTDSGDTFNCSNFLDVDWVSSSGNSCEDEAFDRSMCGDSTNAGLSSENIINESSTAIVVDDSSSQGVQCTSGHTDYFTEWMASGGLLYH